MTKKIIYWLAIVLFALAVIAGAVGLFGQTAGAQPLMTTVSGTVYEYADTSASGTGDVVSIPMRTGTIKIYECRRGGLLIYRREATVRITDGAYSFQVPRSSGTDTTKIRVYAPIPGLDTKGTQGVWVPIPEAATADLESLPRDVYVGVPSGMIAAVPTVYGGAPGSIKRVDTLIVTGDGADVTNPFGTLNIAITGGAAADHGDSIRVADSLARVARNEAASKATRDSLLAIYDSLANHWALIAAANALAATARDIANGKGDADSLKAAYDSLLVHWGAISTLQQQRQHILDSLAEHEARLAATEQVADRALPKADTSALHAQQFADRPTRSEVSDTLDGVTDTGPRSFGTQGRYWADSDSITFAGEAGDVIDCSQGVVFVGTISANDTLSFTNIPPAGKTQTVQVVITQGGTATLSWSGVRWVATADPALTTTANKATVYTFLIAGGIVRGISAADA